MSKSRTITEEAWSADPEDWLYNPHAGTILDSEFLQPSGLLIADVARMIGTSPAQIQAVVSGEGAVDAELDLRLARYFGMSEGFFLRLQNSYDLLEARRALGSELDRIVPRAA